MKTAKSPKAQDVQGQISAHHLKPDSVIVCVPGYGGKAALLFLRLACYTHPWYEETVQQHAED